MVPVVTWAAAVAALSTTAHSAAAMMVRRDRRGVLLMTAPPSRAGHRARCDGRSEQTACLCVARVEGAMDQRFWPIRPERIVRLLDRESRKATVRSSDGRRKSGGQDTPGEAA